MFTQPFLEWCCSATSRRHGPCRFWRFCPARRHDRSIKGYRDPINPALHEALRTAFASRAASGCLRPRSASRSRRALLRETAQCFRCASSSAARAFATARSRLARSFSRVASSLRRSASRRFSSRSNSAAALRAFSSLILGESRLFGEVAFFRAPFSTPRSVGRSDCSANRLLDPAGRLSTTPGLAIAAAITAGSWVSVAKP